MRRRRAAFGALPTPEDHRLGAAPVAVVSYEFWRNALGGPTSLEHIRLKLGYDFQVIGVLPPGFEFPDHPSRRDRFPDLLFGVDGRELGEVPVA